MVSLPVPAAVSPVGGGGGKIYDKNGKWILPKDPFAYASKPPAPWANAGKGEGAVATVGGGGGKGGGSGSGLPSGHGPLSSPGATGSADWQPTPKPVASWGSYGPLPQRAPLPPGMRET